MDKDIELKECPFCGEQPYLYNGLVYHVWNGCSIQSITWLIESWNTRKGDKNG